MEVTSGYKQTDVGIIPGDWELRCVGSMGDVRAGKALAVRGAGQQRPYLRTKNVFDGRIDLADVLRMPMTEAEFSRYRLRHGDVLLNEGQSLELVGRCAMYKDEYAEPCAIQNQLIRFRAGDGVSASFAAQLFRYCQSTGVFAVIALQTTSVAHLGVSRFHRLQLAWPSRLIEQERIAEALGDADTLIESLERLIAKKSKIKQGIMQELLTGRRRLPGFAARLGYKHTEIGAVPEDWEVKTLADLFTFQNGVNADKSAYGGGIPFINVLEVITHHTLTEPRIPGRVRLSPQVRSSFAVQFGDVLFNRTSETQEELGLAAVYTGTSEVVFGGFVIRARPRTSSIDPILASYLLRSPSVRAQIVAWGQGAIRANIGQHDLARVQLPLPGKDEQKAIATVLSEMEAEMAALDAKLAKARQLKQGLMQELLTGRTRLI